MTLAQNVEENTRTPAGRDQAVARRLWLSVALGTLMVTVSFWALIYGFVEGAVDRGGGQNIQAIAAVAFGVAMVPLVFVVVAFVSGHPLAPLATLKAMSLALVVGVPVLAIVGNPVTGLVVGYGAGAVAALRPPIRPSSTARILAVFAMGVLSMVLTMLAIPVALAMAPSLPLAGVALADHWPNRIRPTG